MASVDEDEWEYEYDEDQTEDFYVTLDLSNVLGQGNTLYPSGTIRPSLAGNPILLQSKLRALNFARRNEEAAAGPSGSDATSSMGQMQVIGLHTTNPLVMYDNQLLSCRWASSIGTDMFFVKADPDTASNEQSLRSLPSVDLLAMSSTKLMASGARLRPRDEIFQAPEINEGQATEPMDLSHDTQLAVNDVREDIPETAPSVVQETSTVPNSFLTRLNHAKAKRGDKSRLAVSQTAEGNRLVATAAAATEDTVMGGADDKQ